MYMYTAHRIASAFEALYSNKDGLLDKMLAFWSVISERFTDNENMICYNILYEP